MSRFFVQPENVGTNSIFIDDAQDLHHMIKVLRLKEGDVIDVSDSTMWEYEAEIVSLDRDMAEARIVDKQKFTAEPSIMVTIFQGIPKHGKMETIVQKTVELGVNEIVPVFMARTVVNDKGNLEKKQQRWQKIAAEAVKQCRRGIIPKVKEAADMNHAISCFGSFDLVLFPYENEEGVTIKDVLREELEGWKNVGLSSAGKRIAIMIGPEGGFSDDEAKKIVEAGGKSVSLGKTTLRTETAGMAALAMAMYELEL